MSGTVFTTGMPVWGNFLDDKFDSYYPTIS